MSEATNGAKRVRVELNDFQAAWESSNSAAEVAKKLGMKPASVLARASKARSEGLPLKKMKGGSKKVDMTAAIAKLAEIRGTTVEAIQAEAAAYKAKLAEKSAKTETVSG